MRCFTIQADIKHEAPDKQAPAAIAPAMSLMQRLCTVNQHSDPGECSGHWQLLPQRSQWQHQDARWLQPDCNWAR